MSLTSSSPMRFAVLLSMLVALPARYGAGADQEPGEELLQEADRKLQKAGSIRKKWEIVDDVRNALSLKGIHGTEVEGRFDVGRLSYDTLPTLKNGFAFTIVTPTRAKLRFVDCVDPEREHNVEKEWRIPPLGVVGFSRDSLVALFMHNLNSRDDFTHEFLIYDLVKDAAKTTFTTLGEFESALPAHKIVPTTPSQLAAFPFKSRGYTYGVELVPLKREDLNPEGGDRLYLTRGNEKKEIALIKPIHRDVRGVNILGYLRSPFEERIMIVAVMPMREIEEQDPNMQLRIYGAHLLKGNWRTAKHSSGKQ